MKVFVTGHRGYIGAHLVQLLKLEGHYVIGCDLYLYASSRRGALTEPDLDLCLDIRTISPKQLAGCDCVMHLAAISNDPMGELDPKLTEEINIGGTMHLARAAKKAGVPRFLFSSSCSIYGQGTSLDLDEDAPLHPQSAYAHSKILAEKQLALLATSEFSPSFLRNATAFGDSPMLRLDLVVNNLLACAMTKGEVRIQSDGTPWRPLIHAKDIARAFIAFLHAPRTLIHNLAVNIGANRENVQVHEIAKKILSYRPDAKIVFTGEVGADPRNYRVCFDRLYRLLPDFKLAYTLDRGIEEMTHSFASPCLTREEFEGGKFTRLTVLKRQFSEGAQSGIFRSSIVASTEIGRVPPF